MSAESVAEVRLAPDLHVIDGEQQHPGPEIILPSDVEYGQIPTGWLNIFSQQRPGRNEEQEALTNSLRGGQVNAVNVVIASPELVEEYRRFTNKTWGSNITSDELRMMPTGRFAGQYAILVAGHSRVQGKRDIARQEIRNPDDELVRLQLHPAEDIAEILRIQLAENIHRQPAKDRTLRAVAEMLLWLQEMQGGRPVKKTEFARYYRVSTQTINDAMGYVALPQEIRRLTDDGALPIGITVELARARQAVYENAFWIASRDPVYTTPENVPVAEHAAYQVVQHERAEELVKVDMLALMAQIFRLDGGPTKNIGKSRVAIREYARTLRERNAARQLGGPVVQQELDMVFETYAGELERKRAQFRKDLEEYFSRRSYQGRDLARRLLRMENVVIEGAEKDPEEDLLLQGALV